MSMMDISFGNNSVLKKLEKKSGNAMIHEELGNNIHIYIYYNLYIHGFLDHGKHNILGNKNWSISSQNHGNEIPHLAPGLLKTVWLGSNGHGTRSTDSSSRCAPQKLVPGSTGKRQRRPLLGTT